MAEAPRTDWAKRAPDPRLAAYVESYLGYSMKGFPPGLHRGLPGRNMTFIVSIGNPIDVVEQTDPAEAPGSYRCVVGGLQMRQATISHCGEQEGVAIELTPLGSRALLGTPAAALWNSSHELGDVVGRGGDELWERLQLAVSWDERLAACDTVLLGLLAEAQVAPELDHSWHRLVETGGSVGVAELAAEVGWTRQHLARRFGREFGLAPKSAGRVMRFERARRMLQHSPSYVTLAQVAASCGYFDQSHFTHEFVEMAGCTPSQWLIDEVPSVQDRAGGEPSP